MRKANALIAKQAAAILLRPVIGGCVVCARKGSDDLRQIAPRVSTPETTPNATFFVPLILALSRRERGEIVVESLKICHFDHDEAVRVRV